MSTYTEINGKNYRINSAIILRRVDGKVLWCERIPHQSPIHAESPWQFPQGGVDEGETPLQAALRELWEETGASSVGNVIEGEAWKYDFPAPMFRKNGELVDGQYQRWFLAEFLGTEAELKFPSDEFSAYKWVPLSLDLAEEVVPFKREIYRNAIAGFLGKE